MIATVTHIGLKTEQQHKTAGQIAYEAAGIWVVEHDTPSKALPTWETLDAHAREYWDRVGEAPLIAALEVYCKRSQPAATAKPIRGLWKHP